MNNRIEVRVRYADTDAMGVVYHSNYLIWFEMGRTELIRKTGIPYKDMEKLGVSLPVIEARVFYKSPARYDDVLVVETNLAELKRSKFKLYYRIYCKHTDKISAEGYTVHCFLSRSGKPIRAPENVFSTLKSVFAQK